MPVVINSRALLESPLTHGRVCRVRLDLKESIAKAIWKAISPRYTGLIKEGAPLNTYIRDLILKDTGIDIATSIWQKHDPLCDELVVAELLHNNPDSFSEKQKWWLKLRATGMSACAISRESKKVGPSKGWDKGHTQENISVFFQRVRKRIGFEQD